MQTAALIKYLHLPLQMAPLLVILLFSFLATMALNAGLLVGIPMLLILGSWFFKYSFVLLDHVVDGKHNLPALAFEMVNPVEQRPLGILFVIGCAYLGTMSLEPTWGEWPVRSLRAALLLIVPAMIAAMSVTGRFLDALNPVAVFGTIARIPLAYAQLLVAIAALWFAPFFLLQALGFVPPIFWSLALFMYLWLAMCSCIGGIAYEHRLELGYDPVHSPERSAAKAEVELGRERDKIIDPIFAQVRGGALANAGAAVRKLIDESQQPLDEFRWLYAHAARWPDRRLAEYLVQLCLPRLLDARANGEALDRVRERLRANLRFRPTTSAQLVRIATLARHAGDYGTVRALLGDFESRYPNDAATSMAAKLRVELER